MKILHIGVFNRNIGDNIALFNVQRAINEKYSNVEWINYNLEKLWGKRNSEDFTIEMINSHKNLDYVIVGGGGLLEYAGYSNTSKTQYKLPFTKNVLDKVNTPVIFFGVGVNIFRGGIDYNDVAKKHVQDIINHSAGFSVRNDGSYEKLRDWIKLDVNNVDIIPDPGLLYLEELASPVRNKLHKPGVQPAFNHSNGINRHRYLDDCNENFIREQTKNYTCYPHTIVDIDKLGKKSIIGSREFKTYKSFGKVLDYVKLYDEVDHVLAFRGHGQLITIGRNLPGIYLSTQDKVKDFSLLNGFEDYNVDILEEDWRGKLVKKLEDLRTNNNNFLSNWYSIREQMMPKWYELNNNFIDKVFK